MNSLESLRAILSLLLEGPPKEMGGLRLACIAFGLKLAEEDDIRQACI